MRRTVGLIFLFCLTHNLYPPSAELKGKLLNIYINWHIESITHGKTNIAPEVFVFLCNGSYKYLLQLL